LLAESNLKGSIPTELAVLFSLKTIVFNNNHISGSIPSSFAQLINLRDLWLNHNELSGTLPTLIERFIGLRSLDVSHNFLIGVLPIQVGSFQFVEMLALDNNQFTGRVDSIFNLKSNRYGGLRKLKYLYLEGNRFDGPIGDGFLYLEGSSDVASSLLALDLSNNRFTGTLPSHIFSGFPDLQIFDASYNLMTGKLPQNMIPNEALTFLALQGNSLTGEVSGLLPELQGLTHLDVSNNQFKSWHVDLGAMTSLNYLFLANNPFPVGSFPPFVTLLTNLQELSLKGTQRTGIIPASLGNLQQLVLLDLDNNQFSGAIPSAIGMLDKLQFLLLNRNRLQGSVPSDFRNLSALRK
jgi:Leucine-rich repeat (LRR) protein